MPSASGPLAVCGQLLLAKAPLLTRLRTCLRGREKWWVVALGFRSGYRWLVFQIITNQRNGANGSITYTVADHSPPHAASSGQMWRVESLTPPLVPITAPPLLLQLHLGHDACHHILGVQQLALQAIGLRRQGFKVWWGASAFVWPSVPCSLPWVREHQHSWLPYPDASNNGMVSVCVCGKGW